MQLIDQPGLQKLAHRGGAAADTDITPARSSPGLLQRRHHTLGDEVEVRAPLHAQHGSGMVGQHECRNVIGRLIAPPALPVFVGPGAAHRAEHIAPQNPGADVVEGALGHPVVDAGFTAMAAPMHPLKDLGGEEPFHECSAADAQRVLQILARPGGVTVERDAEAQDFDCHDAEPFKAWNRWSAHSNRHEAPGVTAAAPASMLRYVTAHSSCLRYKASMKFA